MVKTFKGGIHPKDNKAYTEQKPISGPLIPERVVIPLSQHIGVACEPKVTKGDRVKRGQLIGESSSFISSPIHASISGEVIEISKMPHPVLGSFPAIVIESDKMDSSIEPKPCPYWRDLSREELLFIIKQAGIVGLGGAGFPTHVKLSPPKDKPIDTVILNGAECEPYLTCDHRIMVERTNDIIEGLRIIMKILGARRSYIGLEMNKVLPISLIKKAIKDDEDIKIVLLKTKYPQGSEKQLIKTILNREIPSKGLPLDVGVVVQNVATALAVMEAVVKGIPLVDRVITITGDGIKEPANMRIRIGTLFQDVIEACGGFVGEPYKIIMGGPMMGIAQRSLDVPVIKGSCGILVLSKKERLTVRDCIRCGRCIEACPLRLMPNMLGLLIENRRFNEAERYSLSDCMECGCCSYVCPSNRPLVHLIKFGKLKLSSG